MQEEEVDTKKEIIQAVFNKEGYKTNIKKLIEAISSGHEEILTTLVDAVFIVLNSQDEYSPDTKLFSIRAIKDIMSLKQQDVVTKVSEELTPSYLEIAQYRSEDKDDDRGKTLFGDDPNNYVHGNSFFRLILECIYVWAIWFPGTIYEETYHVLVDGQVAFPKKLSYFKPEDLDPTNKNIIEEQLKNSQIQKESYHDPSQHSIHSNRENNSNHEELVRESQVQKESFRGPSHHSIHSNRENNSNHEEIVRESQVQKELFRGPSHHSIPSNSNRENPPLILISTHSDMGHSHHNRPVQKESFKIHSKENNGENPLALVSAHSDKGHSHHNLEELFKESKVQKETLKAPTHHSIHSKENNSYHENPLAHSEHHNKKDLLIEEIQISCQNLYNLQDYLSSLISHEDENEAKSEIEELIENFRKVKTKHQALCQEISEFNDPEFEQLLLGKLMDEIEKIESVIEEYEKFLSGKIPFKTFRYELSNLEGTSKAQNEGTPEHHHHHHHHNHHHNNPEEEEKCEPIKRIQTLEQIKEEEINSKVTSLNSISIMRITENFDEMMFQKEVFSNIKNFNEHRRNYLIYAKSDSLEIIMRIIECCNALMIQSDMEPIRKILAMRFIKEAMDKKNPSFIHGVSSYILDTIGNVASFNFQSKERSRGKDYFGKNTPDNEKLGLTYFLLALESIVMWARWFPKDPSHHSKPSKFMRKYEELIEKGVTFPETLTYFKDLVYESENIEQDFYRLKKAIADVLTPTESDCNQKSLLVLIKDVSMRLNSEKIIEIMTKLINKKNNHDRKNSHEKPALVETKEAKHIHDFEAERIIIDQKFHFERLDQDLKFFKKILIEFENYHGKIIPYSDFRQEFLEIYNEKHIILIKHSQALYEMGPEPLDADFSFIEVSFIEDDQEIGNHLDIFEKYKTKPILLLVEMFQNLNSLKPLIHWLNDHFSQNQNYKNKFEALLLLKHAMDIQNPEFAIWIENEILNTLNSTFYEENKPMWDQDLENFNRLHFECILKWTLSYPEIHGQPSKFALIMEEFYGRPESSEKLAYFDMISYDEYEKNQISEHCYFHKPINESLEFFRFLKSEFLGCLERALYKNDLSEHKMENFLLVFEDIIRHQEHFHSNETEENVAFFHNSLRHFEIYQIERNDPKAHELFIKNILSAEKNGYQESLLLSPGTPAIQKSFFHDSLYLKENEENKLKPFIATMSYNPSFLKPDKNQKRPQSFLEESENGDLSQHFSHQELINHSFKQEFQESPMGSQQNSPLTSKLGCTLTKQHSPIEEVYETKSSQQLVKSEEVLKENNEQNEQIQKLNEILEKTVYDLKEQKTALLSQVHDLENKVEKHESEIFQLNNTLESKKEEIRELKKEIEEIKKNPSKEEDPKANAEQISQIQAKLVSDESPIKLETSEKKREPSLSHNDQDSMESPYLIIAEDVPLEKEMIFPFKTSLEYFSSKTAKQYKGHLVVEDNDIFKEIEQSFQDLKKFKLACLKQKQLVHKGSDIHIGTVSNIQSHQGKNYLRLGAFLTNVSGGVLKNLDYEIIGNENVTIWSKASNSNQELAFGGQRKLEAIMAYGNVPYKVLQMNIKTQTENPVVQETSIFLPTTINKFMTWGNCDNQLFADKWDKAIGRKNAVPYKSRAKKLNLKLVKSLADLKIFFPQTVELNDENSAETKKRSNFGGVFQILNSQIELLIKLTVSIQDENFTIRLIEGSDEEANMKLKEFIIRTFMFLLGNNESKV